MNYPEADSKTTIAPDVLLTIARLTALGVPGVSRLSQVPNIAVQNLIKHGRALDGVVIDVVDGVVYLDLYVVLVNDVNVLEVSRNIQHQVSRAISEMVGMQVGRVNIHIEDIDYPPETEA